MSVSLRKKPNNGTISLYLDIYHNGKRYKEYLKECKQIKVVSPSDRAENRERMKLAKDICVRRALQLQSNDEGIIPNHNKKVELKAYFENYLENYTKKDKRNVQGAYNKFLDFAKEEKLVITTLRQLTENNVQDFADYLKHHCTGEGAHSYFARFKKVLRQAVKDKILLQSPANDVSIEREESFTKDILSINDIQKLASTEISNNEVKKAFLFSCFTGLRWVDIKDLKWKHIDLKENLLNKVQAKTDVKVAVTLNATALSLLPEKGHKEELVFKLPSHTGALKTLSAWLKKAEIEKHITWHCARHSFATNLIIYDTNVLIVSKLLGHNSMKYTQRYTHIANDLKKKATDNLPTINISK
jgi:integrase/recombinase XerD